MDKRVIIIGAGGHGKVVADAVMCRGDCVLGFLDDAGLSKQVCGIPVLGCIDQYVDYPQAEFVVAIGNSVVREKITKKLAGVRWYTAIHPTAVVSDLDTVIGEGTVIMAGAIVNPGAHIGQHCIINTGAIVEHDNRIGDFSHISVGAKLAGTVSVGEHSWIGLGAVVRNNLSICDRCVIGAGAVVVKDVTEPGTYVGVPARVHTHSMCH